MKVHLPKMVALAMLCLIFNPSFSQCDINGSKKFYTSSTPLTIDGGIIDWQNEILGVFNTNANPFPSPASPANIQTDASRTAVSPAQIDLDAPNQDQRDLRYFAVTWSNANAYFYARRGGNVTSQQAFYYMVDINGDGFLKTGEPVFKISFTNGGGASLSAQFYRTKLDATGTAATGYVAGSGDPMLKPTAPNQGLGDGYSMPGETVDCAVTAIAGAQVAATEAGYGFEYSMPWAAFQMYANDGVAIANSAINSSSFFTWHVSLVAGNSGTNTANDNAGGCNGCVATTETHALALINSSAYHIGGSKVQFDVFATNNGNITENVEVLISQVSITGSGTYGLTVYDDADNDNLLSAAELLGGVNYPTATPKSAPVAGQTTHHFIVRVTFPPSGILTLGLSVTGRATYQRILCDGTRDNSPTFLLTIPFFTNINLIVLPLQWEKLMAQRMSTQQVKLHWETTNELGIKQFELWRKTENEDWQMRQEMNAKAGNSNSYDWLDLNAENANSKYRIKVIEKSGAFYWSDVLIVAGNKSNGITVLLTPQPAHDFVNISIAGNQQLTARLLNMNGMEVQTMKLNNNANRVSIGHLPKGMYLLQLMDAQTKAIVAIEKMILQ